MNNDPSAVQVLIDDHQKVLAKLQVLESIFTNLDQKEDNVIQLKELIDFFKTDFWVHFDKEEQAFFPEFDNFMPHGTGPLAVMVEEHGVIKDTNDILQEAVAQYLGAGDNEDIRRQIKESGMHFIEFLRAHIFKEDNLFPQLAEMHLGMSQNTRVKRLFNEIEMPH